MGEVHGTKGAKVEWGKDAKFAGHSADADLKLLGLAALPATAAELMAAFRAVVKAAHGQEGVDSDAIVKAKDRLLETIKRGVGDDAVNHLPETSCRLCGGSGRIGTGFGQECPSCKGTGQIP